MYSVGATVIFVVLLSTSVISVSTSSWTSTIPFIVFFVGVFILRRIVLSIEMGTLDDQMEKALEHYEEEKEKRQNHMGAEPQKEHAGLKVLAKGVGFVAQIFGDPGLVSAGANALFAAKEGPEDHALRQARIEHEELKKQVDRIKGKAYVFAWVMASVVTFGWFVSYRSYLSGRFY